MLKYYEDYSKDEEIEFQKSVIKEKNDYITSLKSSNISENHLNFEHEKADRLTVSLKNKERENLLIIGLGIFVVLSLILLIVSLRLHAKNMRIQKDNQIQVLTTEYEKLLSEQAFNQKQIKILEQNIDFISKDNNEISKSNIALKNEITSAFLKQFSWLDKLGSMYHKANKSPQEREKILYETVNQEIKLLASKNNFLKQVEELMARHSADLLKNIDGLKLIRSEREIVIYSVCGLSPALSAILANKSLRAVYNLKARIKEKLTRLDTPFARQILEFL